MNLIAKIKRLEAEAAERDKRIAALEAMVKAAVNATFPKVITVEPRKKRSVRAKTSGTE